MVFIPEPSLIPLTCPFSNDRLIGTACRMIGCADGLMLTKDINTVVLKVDYEPFIGDDRQFLMTLFSTARAALRLDEEELKLIFDFDEPGKLTITRLVH